VVKAVLLLADMIYRVSSIVCSDPNAENCSRGLKVTYLILGSDVSALLDCERCGLRLAVFTVMW